MPGEGVRVPDGSGPVIQQTSSRVVYETPHMRLREDGIRRPDGSTGTYSYVEKPDFALIIPVENGGFHLVEQYRYPVRMRCWEFPPGTADVRVAIGRARGLRRRVLLARLRPGWSVRSGRERCGSRCG